MYEYEIKKIKHQSSNKCYEIKISNKKYFMKKFASKLKWEREKNALEQLNIWHVVVNVDKRYYIIMKYIELQKINNINSENIDEIVKLMVEYHNLNEPKKIFFHDLLKRVKEKTIEKKYMPYYNFFKNNIKEKEVELCKIHGDFGIRNLFINQKKEKILIDFERSTYQLREEEFIKLFYRELKNPEIKKNF